MKICINFSNFSNFSNNLKFLKNYLKIWKIYSNFQIFQKDLKFVFNNVQVIIYPTYLSKLYLDPNIKNGSKNKIDTEIALIFWCIFSCFHVFWHFKDRCQLDVYIQCWYVWKLNIKMSHCQWKKLISHSFLSDIQPEQ